MKGPRWLTVVSVAWLAASSVFSGASDESKSSQPTTPAASSGLYIKVQLNGPVNVSKLKSGDMVEGRLLRDVYSSDRELFSAGNPVQLKVDHMERRRRAPNDHWPWLIKALTPRHENYPVFKDGTVSGPNGKSALQVSLICISHKREVRAQAKKKAAADQQGSVEVSKSDAGRRSTAATMVLEAFAAEDQKPVSGNGSGMSNEGPSASNPETLPAGTRCKILLLGDVSASKSNPGDVVHARLLEPVVLDSHVVLPAGSVFEGKVMKRTPPRWLSRAGSLYLSFTGLSLPGGSSFPVAASVAGAELDQRSRTKIDAEGRLHGDHPGKAWMAINLGVAAGFAKVADDGTQLVLEALISTATDVSTAGTGRIVSSCISGIFMVTRRGRDVLLPRFTEMDISLDRAVSLTPNTAAPAMAVVTGNE
jgi:hypothetical protein